MHTCAPSHACAACGYDDLECLATQPAEALRAIALSVGMKPGHAAKFAWALASPAAGR